MESSDRATALTLRRVTPADHESVAALLVEAYAPSGMSPNDPYFAVLADVAGRAASAEVWVAADGNGSVLGTVTWCPPGSALREVAADDEVEFRMLAVAPSTQGRGLGRAIVHWLLDRAAAEGFAAIALSSADWMTAAHRLYEAEGFVRVPSRDRRPRPGVALLAYVRSAQAACGC